jgi:dTDP-4-dehydrorhamnose reductase
VNVEMSGRLAALAAQTGAQFVYISSDSVFDGVRGSYAEEDQVKPVNAYARSKLDGETAVRALVVRTNIYGWNMQPKTGLAEWILSQLESGSEVPGFQDVIFCPILVNDLGDAILEMLERKLSGLYHVAGSEPCSKYEFALHLAGTFGLDKALVRPSSIEQSTLQAPRPKNTSLRTARIHRALGRAMPSLDAGLLRFKALRDSGFVARLRQSGREEAHACAKNR